METYVRLAIAFTVVFIILYTYTQLFVRRRVSKDLAVPAGAAMGLTIALLTWVPDAEYLEASIAATVLATIAAAVGFRISVEFVDAMMERKD